MHILARSLGISIILTSIGLQAQVVNNFEGATPGSEYGFRHPRFSGSSSAHLATTPNTHAVVEGWAGNETQVGSFNFAFLDDSATRWVRLTTFNAAGVPNPILDLNQTLQFDIYSANDIKLALIVREDADLAGPIGANGGTSGGLEWVGAEQAGTSAPGGTVVPGGSWQTVSFNLKGDPAFNFVNGNGVIEGDWGTLEALAFTSLGGPLEQSIYIDNLVMVPEPGTVGLLALGGVVLVAAWARRRKA